MSQRIKVLAPSGGPSHRMQPTSGAIPPIEFHLHDDGQVELCMFCRSGPNRGKWWNRVGPAAEMLGFLGHLYQTANASGANHQELLCHIAEFFQWEWDKYGSLPSPEAGPTSGTSGLTLEDLGL